MKKIARKNTLSPPGPAATGELFAPETVADLETAKTAAPTGRIGTDESGKGDYFGPLVVAAVWANSMIEDKLLGWGVRDSKKLTDKRVVDLAAQIMVEIPHAVVIIGPEKYNELYAKIRNLNRLLAWAHARAIENLLEDVACDMVIADKFGDEKYIKDALLQKGREVTLIQQVRAESDAAVAAASVVARANFLERLAVLSRAVGVELRKGASDLVDQAGVQVLRAGGEDKLRGVAKWHFKNTQKILRLNKP
jgi:ribonuclease HIII